MPEAASVRAVAASDSRLVANLRVAASRVGGKHLVLQHVDQFAVVEVDFAVEVAKEVLVLHNSTHRGWMLRGPVGLFLS